MLQSMYTPIKIGSCEIKNRFAVTAMVTNMCDEKGAATERYIKYHEAKAKGGWGLIITEDYRINPHAGGFKYVAGLYDNSLISSHKKMTDAVHKYGARIFCQIYSAGRQQNHFVNGGTQPVAASPMACPWNRDVAREASKEDIKEIVHQFGISAANAKKAGFDGVEIHAGNGYLIAGFLSYYQNKRTDEYGGCFYNRIRLLHEVYDSVRLAVGDDFPIMVRFSAEEHTISGRTLDESLMIARELESWGVNAINCSNGVYGTYNPGQVSPSYRPHGWTIHNAERMKQVVSIPVLGSNSIDDPLLADFYIGQGYCDIVGMARCSLADPEMPNKALEGRFNEIRPCIRCMQGCTLGGPFDQHAIRCLMNPELGHEYIFNYESPAKKKKVLVIGGGVGGAYAAIAAARRGHDVTLWEKSDRIGGQFITASYPPGKGEAIMLSAYLDNELKKQQVNVVFGKEAATNDILDYDADKIIIATGGIPNRPNIPGIDKDNIYFAEDVLLGRKLPEGRIVVVGGGEVGVETAMHLADGERGKITILEMTNEIASGADGTRIVAMKKFLSEREVSISLNTRLVEFCDSGLLVDSGGQSEFIECDAAVLAMGYHSNNALALSLTELGDKLVVIGDAARFSNALEAGTDGFAAGYNA